MASGTLLQAGSSVWFGTLTAREREEHAAYRERELWPGCDVLVIGGGLIGAAVLWGLSQRGVRAQLISAEGLAEGATGSSAGGVWPNDLGAEIPADRLQLAFDSRDLWGRWSVQPGFQADWRVNGLLHVCPERFGPSVTEYAVLAQARGIAATAVDGEQIRMLEPGLRPGLRAGLHLPAEAQVHPVRGTLSAVRAAVQKGANAVTGVRVERLEHRPQGGLVVRTQRGVISAERVVVATGWETGLLPPEWCPAVPVRPVAGQMLSTPAVPKLLRGTVVDRYVTFQLKTGEVVIGGNLREGAARDLDGEQTAEMERALRELLPGLSDVPIVRGWAGVRPGTPDGWPVIDRAPGNERVWVCQGHYRNGILLAPATGVLLADWLVTDRRPPGLECCRADRF